jgi:hypothetical protein
MRGEAQAGAPAPGPHTVSRKILILFGAALLVTRLASAFEMSSTNITLSTVSMLLGDDISSSIFGNIYLKAEISTSEIHLAHEYCEHAIKSPEDLQKKHLPAIEISQQYIRKIDDAIRQLDDAQYQDCLNRVKAVGDDGWVYGIIWQARVEQAVVFEKTIEKETNVNDVMKYVDMISSSLKRH